MFIDASATEENYEEEEGFYGEEDVENFDHLSNQGKLLPCASYCCAFASEPLQPFI